MNDDIKEILEYLEGIDETRNTKILTTNETNILLDYITNLQHTEDLYNQLLKDYDVLLGDTNVKRSDDHEEF